MDRIISSSSTIRLPISRAIALLVISAFVIGMMVSPTASAISDSDTLQEDEMVRYLIYNAMSKDDELDVSVTFTSGGPGDVYIMLESEYNKLNSGLNFNAVVTKERVQNVDFEWTMPDDDQWVLVIDNSDNAHANDAEPTGSLSYDLDYSTIDEGLLALIMGGMVAIVIVLIIVNILILVWIYKDAEKRGKSGIGWLIFALICGPLACLLWLLVRPPAQGQGQGARHAPGSATGLRPTTRPVPATPGPLRQLSAPAAPATATPVLNQTDGFQWLQRLREIDYGLGRNLQKS